MCSQHLWQPTPASRPDTVDRREPFFVPENFDFTIFLRDDQRYTELVSKYLWVPVYLSDVKDRYEMPKERGTFDRVELVPLHKEHRFSFEADSEEDSMSGPGPPTATLPNSWNKGLQNFLSFLTGWKLLVVFFAVQVQHNKWSHSRKGQSDVLCFQKGKQKRIAIRRKSAKDESTIEWMTATLEKAEVESKHETLLLKLGSMQKGELLALATVTAVMLNAPKPSKSKDLKSEDWTFTVKCGAAEVHHVLTVSGSVIFLLARMFVYLTDHRSTLASLEAFHDLSI